MPNTTKMSEEELKQNAFATARRIMGEHLNKDEGLYISYHANITMWLNDHSEMKHAKCEKLAHELISLIWSLAPRQPK